MSYHVEDGKALILLARQAIGHSLSDSVEINDERLTSMIEEFIQEFVTDQITSKYSELQGCFVTLRNRGDLRGCIGHYRLRQPLYQAVIKSAVEAAFTDNRFLPVTPNELNEIEIEVNILSEPELLQGDYQSYAKQIVIGQHGLIIDAGIIDAGYRRGLLLPWVFTEDNCTPLEALEMVCRKAGLDSKEWKYPENKLYRFETQVFLENGGKVIEPNVSTP